jgi:hypothetical protein
MIFLVLGLVIIPFAVIATLAPYWQKRVFIAVIAIYLAWIIWKIAAYLWSRAGRGMPQSGNWSAGQSASAFQINFIHYMQEASCQVTWSKIADTERVGFAVRKGKRVVVLLCLSPAAHISEWDLTRLSAWGRDQKASSSAVVTPGRTGNYAGLAEADATTIFLSYEDLSSMAWIDVLFGNKPKVKELGEMCLGGPAHAPPLSAQAPKIPRHR